MILVMNYGDLLGGGADVRMHVPQRLTAICMAQIADVLLVGLVLFGVLEALSRTRFYPWAKLVVAIVVPPYIIERMRDLFPFDMRDGVVPLLGAIWAAMVLLLLLRFRRRYANLLKLGDVAGVFLSMFAICSIAQMLYVGLWKPFPNEHHAVWETTAQPPREHARVVWILFDELSYNQVFEHRARDLELPNFDALKAQSMVFTNVQPIGYKTVKIVPSLLIGHVVDDYRYTFDNSFFVHYAGAHGWKPVDGSTTIFADAQEQQWRTAVVGWYNPYCTIYGDAIDDCYWNNLDKIDGPMAQKNSFWRNTYSPLANVVRELKAPARADRDACTYDVRQRLKTHLDLQEHAFKLLETDQADFVYLHLSNPHSPNIWSRIKGDYTQFCGSSYLDNLALADRVLGEIMTRLQASPRWKDTTVVVQGDHGWRVHLWDWMPAWTDEDDQASNDDFDPRPALIIHQAGQTQGQLVTQAWPLLGVHNVLEDVINGKPPKY
ncbi:MAG: sulfatase-like hydrolase/transferase [Acidobacteriota bacterium]